MIQKISASISVELIYDHRQHTVTPRRLFWNGRLFRTTQLGLHHTQHQGQTLLHFFSVVSQGLFFKLKLDTDTLHWTLEEISDGLAN